MVKENSSFANTAIDDLTSNIAQAFLSGRTCHPPAEILEIWWRHKDVSIVIRAHVFYEYTIFRNKPSSHILCGPKGKVHSVGGKGGRSAFERFLVRSRYFV